MYLILQVKKGGVKSLHKNLFLLTIDTTLTKQGVSELLRIYDTLKPIHVCGNSAQ